MLQLLHIENIAIIECADIEFRPGFNALTGETGAGKSIVIDSISAVLGQRTSRDLIRTGANMAFVSACFTDIPPWLGEDLGIAWEGELLLQREIHGDGKNVCRVNGRPVTVTQLRTLGSRLLNIHGQHDGQQRSSTCCIWTALAGRSSCWRSIVKNTRPWPPCGGRCRPWKWTRRRRPGGWIP
jgi:DNA repair protein RecN (Recombination protein N)